MKFIECTDGGTGGSVLVPLDNTLIIFKEKDEDVPSSFYAWTIGKDSKLIPMKYTAVGQSVADSIVTI